MIDNQKANEWISLLADLPPIAKLELYDNKLNCQSCRTIYDKHKPLKLDQIPIINTGVIHATDKICKECQKLVADLCPVVCVKCKDVVSRMAPGKDKHGFETKKGKSYHIEFCPVCHPETFEDNPYYEMQLIEKTIYDIRIRGLSTKRL